MVRLPTRRLTPRQVWERAAELEFAMPGGFTGLPLLQARGPAKRPRQRGIINDQTRRDLKRLIEAGKTGAEIAKQLQISLPGVQNIKKRLSARLPNVVHR